MCLRYHRDAGDIDLRSIHLRRVRCREEDYKSILYDPLNLPPDQTDHLRSTCRGMGPFEMAVSSAWLDHGGPV